MHNFVNAHYLQMLAGGLTALSNANYPTSRNYIDVSQFDHFVFLIGLDVVATPDFAVLQDTSATETSAIKAVTGASKTDIATGDDGKWVAIEVQSKKLDIDGGFRYVTLQASNVTTDNANIWFIGYRPDAMPVVQHANLLESIIVAG